MKCDNVLWRRRSVISNTKKSSREKNAAMPEVPMLECLKKSIEAPARMVKKSRDPEEEFRAI